MAGNMWDDAAAEEPEEEITLRLLQVVAAPGDNPSWMRVQLKTSRGDIDGVLHPVEGGTSAVICVGGAMGGLDGPAGTLYPRLAGLLAAHLVTTLRLNYRKPNETAECVADVLAGCSFLKGIGGTEVVLVGHSFGAAVVIKAGELAPIVRGVVSMSPQLFGTREVHNLGKPLLLSMARPIRSSATKRARTSTGEPKSRNGSCSSRIRAIRLSRRKRRSMCSWRSGSRRAFLASLCRAGGASTSSERVAGAGVERRGHATLDHSPRWGLV